MGHDRHGLRLIFHFCLSTGDAYGHFTELFIYYYPVHSATCFLLGGSCLICTEKKLNLYIMVAIPTCNLLFVYAPSSLDNGSRVLRRYAPLRSSHI